MKKQFCDERDGKKYVYVEIGEQTWMAENLNYEAEGSKCYGLGSSVFDATARNCINWPDVLAQYSCNIYGRLYNWSMATNNCPAGWHLPSIAEWEELIQTIGSSGIKLKTKTGWDDYTANYQPIPGNGTDDYGFSALPGGSGNAAGFANCYYNGLNSSSVWWASYVDSNYQGSGCIIQRESVRVGYSLGHNSTLHIYVRCVED